ncbi:MAG TPA: SGNH/GDSL hydrolase family protein [Chthoniobacterales bacterium]|nr:SGNH/GDSL hydrolase family protein [Chthoniobacterales bacterium]
MSLHAAAAKKPIRYAVIGDSYSIGEGAREAESWPALLARRLTKSGIPLELVSNPSRTGWTTADAIEKELPVFRAARPDFGTLMLGVNDWVQGVEPETFRQRLARIMDEMQKILPNEKCLLVINIPDFSVTPDGPVYARGRDIRAGLTSFNKIIAEEAATRHLGVVDIFPLSQKMGTDHSLVAADGLHPSAKAYAQWEELIEPAARALIESCRPGDAATPGH